MNSRSLFALLFVSLALVAGQTCRAQDDALATPKPPAAEAAEQAELETAAETTAPAESAANPTVGAKEEDADAPAAPTTGAGDGPTGDDKADATTADDAAKTPAEGSAKLVTEGAAEATDAAAKPFNWPLLLAVLAVLILPVFLANKLSKQFGMPDHGWKIGLILASIAASVLCVMTGQFKGGPDLAGGITLVYELEDPSQIESVDTNNAKGQPKQQVAPGQAAPVKMDDLIAALKQRVDPAGTREVTIRRYGDAVEIIIPKAGEDELEFIKRRITDLGNLEFRITADPQQGDADIIERAKQLGPSQKLLQANDRPVAEWVKYDEDQFGAFEDPNGLVKRMAGKTPEALVLIDRLNVTGKYLANSAAGFDKYGKPAVEFAFDSRGASRFSQLTRDNLPNATTGAKRRLGILLDKRLISAPGINSEIGGSGIIEGMPSEEEVNHVVGILNAGKLPAALKPAPISEESISPTLGLSTIKSGSRAIGLSLAAVLLFMVYYYRSAGVIACLALALNLLLVVAIMVLIGAAFTLPGLAGLVLTVGMSVDANVLIYERMREEIKRGAALRMAIRNGFSKALSTIVDSNVTTIITGVVLYVIGTDQIKGFAVTLILGILTSMFTAVFCSHVLFDIAERRKWITQLNFSSIIGETNIDFLSKGFAATMLSLILIAIGAFAVYSRGPSMLNIDFTGGSSVTMAVNADAKLTQAKVEAALLKTEMAEKSLTVVERGDANDGTRFSVTSSIDDKDAAKKLLVDTFGKELQGYLLKAGEVTPYSETGYEGSQVDLTYNDGPGFSDDDAVSYETPRGQVIDILKTMGSTGVEPTLENPEYQPGSNQRFKMWTLKLPLPVEKTQELVTKLQSQVAAEPFFPLASKVGGAVAGDMKSKAIQALIASIIGVIIYLWFRFESFAYGIAAAVAVIHDVLVTLGFLALSSYIVQSIPGLAQALQIESFQLSLTIVAALLTIIGYSLNDTIVIFDRIREVKGKSPKLTPEMVNLSLNQTLSRTILTSLTVFLTVVILYFFGGPGIHGFAFAMVVGVLAGTYSTVFIACPVLLWLVNGRQSAPIAAQSAAA